MTAPRRIIFHLLCWVCVAGWGDFAAEESVHVARLRQLLARVDGEPLALIATLDARTFVEHLTQTAAGRAFNDPQYAPNRRGAMILLEERLGAHPEVAWDALRRHVAGPLALVLTAPPADKTSDAPALQLSLRVAVKDAGAVEAVQLGWPQVPADSGHLLGLVALKCYPIAELSKARPVPEWADRCARMSGECQLLLRSRATLRALDALLATTPEAPSWLKTLRSVCSRDLERIELNLLPSGRYCLEELHCEVAADAKGLLAGLLRSLRSDPQPWDAIGAALPGGQDAEVLLQMDLGALRGELPLLLQSFERLLRGKRWTRLCGDSEEALAPDRFAFLTQPWAGTFGLTGVQSGSGETRITGVAAEPGSEAAERRRKLVEGLRGLELAFETAAGAPRIGGNAPLASSFKGRGVMPAPMIGLANGWLWLCSSTASYHHLVSALGDRTYLAKDLSRRAQLFSGNEAAIRLPSISAFAMHVNLPRVGPMAYTTWMLSENGQRVFNWEVPSVLLPSPGFLKKHLGPYDAVATRSGQNVRVFSRGPFPGGALLPLAGLASVANGMRDSRSSRPAAVRKELETLVRPFEEREQGGRK